MVRSSSIATLIRAEGPTLIGEWVDFARTKLPAARTMSEPDLVDSVDELLEAVADDLETPQTPIEQTDKSRGVGIHSTGAIVVWSRSHAANRVESGFTLDQVISEFRALRASVLRLISVQDDQSLYNLEDLTRFHEAIDQTLTTSAVLHGQRIAGARDMFVAVLGHDLREPLSAIKMASSHMLLINDLPPECTRIGQQIIRSTQRMTRMMDDLLDFTRAKSGIELPLEVRRVDFAEICRAIVAESSLAHPASQFILDCPSMLIGKWDSARLGQMLSNLLANAVAYGATDRPINVGLRDDGQDRAVLRVHNEGRPIAPAELSSIFDPMRRGLHAASDHATQSAGLGLGLSIVKSITSAQKGTVSVESSEVDGTTFTVVLPRDW